MALTIYQQISKTLGLEWEEAKLFEILNSSKENLTVTLLANKLGVQRLKIYSMLDKLNQIGLMESIDSKKGIKVQSPTVILSFLESKKVENELVLNNFSNLLPELLFQYQSTSKTPFIKIIENKNDVIRLFLNLYRESNSDIYFIGNSGQFEDYVGIMVINELIKIRTDKQLELKILAYEEGTVLHEFSSVNAAQKRFVKWLPSKNKAQGYTHFTDKQLVLWNPVLSRAIIINDQTIVSLYKSMFEIIWSLLPEAKA
jgi:sugar-specific transcriptional regulator TrmB